MHNLNNLDIIILFIVGISALIALSRGLVKEVLSIIGWILGTVSVIYLLPIVIPFAKNYIDNGYIAGAVSSICILVLFFIVWIYTTSGIVGKIRTSKLNGMDRLLGLFFGIARAFLLTILFYILMGWVVPQESQSDTFKKSKYFNLAGSFADPLEKLIPEETMKLIKDKALLTQEDNEKEQNAKSEADILFEKLSQPRIKKTIKETDDKNSNETTKGYKESERDNLDRLIENME
ncbi:MAG: CvpA family protein [Alphaproteobacteria bacterium]|nr:CvpA family protein [Alphaproteobacteria bacterium]